MPDAVFEGGGVKGIGLVGAVSEIEKAGYVFENLAGTSAGAIVAALLAVGYKADEIKKEMERLNYNDFKDEGLLDKESFMAWWQFQLISKELLRTPYNPH